jgi:hypothetical protein
MDAAVDAARKAFEEAFGEDALEEATSPNIDQRGSVFGNAVTCTRAGYGNETGNFCG